MLAPSTLWDEQPKATRPAPQPLAASWNPVPGPTGHPAAPPPSDGRRSVLGWFLHRYGWRAYAIPVLAALTVLVIVQVGRPPASTAQPTRSASGPASAAGAPAAAAPSATSTGSVEAAGPSRSAAVVPGAPASSSAILTKLPAAAGVTTHAPAGVTSTGSTATSSQAGAVTVLGLASAALPPNGVFVAQGKGTWHVVPGTTPPMGGGPQHFTYTVEIEDGVEPTQADQQFATLVDTALADPRSWIGSGDYTLQRVDSGTPSFRVSLTSQLTVREDQLCGWEIHYEASCYARDVKRVAINDARWASGSMSYHGDLAAYRVYAINHEVGHALGYVHRPCTDDGGLAPVMMQQSWSTADDDLAPLNPQLIPMDGKVCHANPYPFPLAAVGAPATSAVSLPTITASRSGG